MLTPASYLHPTPSLMLTQDIGPRYSGVLLGMSNTAGVLAGVFGTAATGYILKNGSWDEVPSLRRPVVVRPARLAHCVSLWFALSSRACN